jgi:hypothetical protein
MMGTREPTDRPTTAEQLQPVMMTVTVQRKDPGMNAETLNISPPSPSPPSPTHHNKLVSPFLVTNHPSTSPGHHPLHAIIHSPFLVDPTSLPLLEEPGMFDLEDILKESEVYPLAPPTTALPTMVDMISQLTGLGLKPTQPASLHQQHPPLWQQPAPDPR